MPFLPTRYTLTPAEWTQISTDVQTTVAIENMSILYQLRVIQGPVPPSLNVEHYKTIRPGDTLALNNLPDGSVLWARAVDKPVVIEVLTD